MSQKGEILALFLLEEIPPGDFFDIISHIREQDSIAVFPHPFDKLRSSAFNPDNRELKLIDGLEIFNSRCLFSNFNDKAKKIAKTNSLCFTAGSDAHLANEIGNAGIIIEDDDIESAIRNRNCITFGSYSFPVNLALTKMVKIWRKRKRG